MNARAEVSQTAQLQAFIRRSLVEKLADACDYALMADALRSENAGRCASICIAAMEAKARHLLDHVRAQQAILAASRK